MGSQAIVPTYGLVSRHGAMTLSWSMDKLGPMARSALDCALVFEAIRGADTRDPSTIQAPFPFSVQNDVNSLRVGYLKEAFESDYSGKETDAEALDVLRRLGIDLLPITLPRDLPVSAMLTTLGVEAAAAFDTLTLSGGVDQMVRQGKGTWPHEFRVNRFVPAVEFLQASRCRSILLQRMNEAMQEVDVFVSPTFGSRTLSITNLTGHPCVSVPNGFDVLEDSPDSARRQPSQHYFFWATLRRCRGVTTCTCISVCDRLSLAAPTNSLRQKKLFSYPEPATLEKIGNCWSII